MADMQLIVAPARPMTLQEAADRHNDLVAFVRNLMVEGVDFGKIPGSDKDVLLKPGAEKLTTYFRMVPRFKEVETVEDWTGENHKGEPFFYYRMLCQLYQSDQLIAECIASINSWETKYRYRQGTRLCPECKQPAIFKSKKPGEGYYCWNKKDGCGAQFKADDKRITDQVVGKVLNEQIFDQVNTMIKMVEKRALVGAVLIGVNASEFFTQDMEEVAVDGNWTEAPADKKSEPAQKPAKQQAVRGDDFDAPPVTDEHGNPIETQAPAKAAAQETRDEEHEPAYTTYTRGVLLYRKVDGVEQVKYGERWKPAKAVAGKDLSNATIEDLMAMFPNSKTRKPDQGEAMGHLKKHFKKATWRALTWEEIMVAVMWKKKGLPDHDFYPVEYEAWKVEQDKAALAKAEESGVEIVTTAPGTPHETTAYVGRRNNLRAVYGIADDNQTVEANTFLDFMEKHPNPNALVKMVEAGITGATPENLDKLLSVANMFANMDLPDSGPEFDEVIGYYINAAPAEKS